MSSITLKDICDKRYIKGKYHYYYYFRQKRKRSGVQTCLTMLPLESRSTSTSVGVYLIMTSRSVVTWLIQTLICFFKKKEFNHNKSYNNNNIQFLYSAFHITLRLCALPKSFISSHIILYKSIC